MARRVLGFFFVLTMLFLLSSLGMAEEQKPLLFLVNEELVPIAYKDNGVAKGVVVDIAQALGKKMERPIEVRAMDWLEAKP
ncbi:MAG: amino acid ABC transporter substrate-binding protein [Firmicutes bacterium]|nr:amino acid ABC transporter substrate-binding protein [Bacillota bacterium]